MIVVKKKEKEMISFSYSPFLVENVPSPFFFFTLIDAFSMML